MSIAFSHIPFSHKPVLLKEVLETFDYLKDRKEPVFVDGTVGMAGHSLAIANKLKVKSEKFKVVGIDKDNRAIQNAKIKIQDLGISDLFIFIYDDFGNYDKILKQVQDDRAIDKKEVDGILLDLGVSSMQLDDKTRGFSFLDSNQLLDMRMDQNQIKTAGYILNSYSISELEKMLKRGEERYARAIAKNVAQYRQKKKITKVGDLLEILQQSIPIKAQKISRLHYPTATFRALRIEVNNELTRLSQTVKEMVESLKPGSRIAIITFHSLEDRIVKHTFKGLANPCTCPPQLPMCVCGQKPKIRILTKKPILPSEEEVQDNPRARSAKLRVAEKI